MACATAVQLADRRLCVLLVSTDAASNLDEVLGTPLDIHPQPIASVPNLVGMNLAPEASARDSGTRSRPIAGGPSSGRDRSLRLGHQRVPGIA